MQFYYIYILKLSDVLAGSFGTLSKGKPVNMFTFKKAEKGTSGAISLLGLYLSLVGGVIIALIFSLEHFNLKYFILISLSGLLGSIMDSSLGALVEVKYKCTVCNQETEEKYHCNQKGTIIKGYYFINCIFSLFAGLNLRYLQLYHQLLQYLHYHHL